MKIEHTMTKNAPWTTHQFVSGYYRASLRQARAVVGPEQACLNIAAVGCGAGAHCRRWAQQGHKVYGADIDAALIARARERARESELEIMFDIACASALPWPDRSMDVVLATALLEQGENWRACVAELVRVVTPGGLLYVSYGKWRRFQKPDGNGITAQALRDALAGHGAMAFATRSRSLLAIRARSTDCCPGLAENRCCCVRAG